MAAALPWPTHHEFRQSFTSILQRNELQRFLKSAYVEISEIIFQNIITSSYCT
jgi:hypothetical protein